MSTNMAFLFNFIVLMNIVFAIILFLFLVQKIIKFIVDKTTKPETFWFINYYFTRENNHTGSGVCRYKLESNYYRDKEISDFIKSKIDGCTSVSITDYKMITEEDFHCNGVAK